MLYRNVHPPGIVCRTTKSHLNGLKRYKEFGPERRVITLNIPYISERSVYLEKNIKQLISSTISAATPEVVSTSSPMLTPEGKDEIPYLIKSWLYTNEMLYRSYN